MDNVTYKDLPEYLEWKSKIESALLEELPTTKIGVTPNAYIEAPTMIPEGKFNQACKEVKSIIGEKVSFLRVLGFKQSEGVIPQGIPPLVCQCNCGKYCLVKYKTLTRAGKPRVCSECDIKMDVFNLNFITRYNKEFTEPALSSIFGDTSANPTRLFLDEPRAMNTIESRFDRCSDVELKGLVNQYNALSIDIFRLSEDGNQLYSPKISSGDVSRKLIKNSFVQRPAVLDLVDIPKQYHNRNITQMIGVKHYRFQVVGVLETELGYKAMLGKKATFVLRCDCGMYSKVIYKHLHKGDIKSCGRCILLENEVRRRHEKQTGEVLTFEQAWAKLGIKFNNNQSFHSPIKSDMTNSYFFERSKFDRDTVYSKFSNLFGQRFGFVVVTDKSRRNEKGYRFLVAKCDCGLESVFNFNVFKNPAINPVLMCSQCSYQVDQTLRRKNITNVACRSRRSFDSAWMFYLDHFGYPQDVEFALIWRAYLNMKQQQPNLMFKDIVGKIIEAAIKRKSVGVADPKTI